MRKNVALLWCLFFLSSGLGGCAHSIAINPTEEFKPVGSDRIKINVAYVLTDSDRQKEVITAGGGGDKVKYFPYRDLERTIREVLKSVYQDAFVISSPSDFESIKKFNAAFIFAPEISTTSSSSSAFTWPPTKFSVEVILNVTDADGKLIARPRAIGTGAAEYAEFKTDFGLAAKRAASDLSPKLQREIQTNPRLK